MGGLLWVSNLQSPIGHYFSVFDGNGNLTALVNASDGSVSANYEYGPFGELVRRSGPMAKANPFRFSTKYQDDETDLLYYGHRYYDPRTGRWTSRDPIAEAGGPNVFAFVRNSPIGSVDYLGQKMLTEGNISELKVDKAGNVTGGMQYSCNCGWLDGEHIGPYAGETMRDVLRQMREFEAGGSYFVRVRKEAKILGVPAYAAGMLYKLTYSGTLNSSDRVGTAMAMWMRFSKVYEQSQTVIPWGSGFSVEDLPSNYLGALLAAEAEYLGTGITFNQLKKVCRVLSVEDSKKVYKQGGPGRNKSHEPKLWDCDPCKNATKEERDAGLQLFRKYDLNGYGNYFNAEWGGPF